MKVAIVGCGGIGKNHARAVQALGHEVVYMIDVVPEAARAAAVEFGAKPLTSIGEMTEKPDWVSVATPPALHYDIVMALIARGIAVFCEKPLTTDVAQADEIVRESERTGVPVGVGFKMRYEPVFRKARELAPRIGRLAAISVVKHQPYTPRPNGWVPDTGCMYELSVHEYDLVNWILGVVPEYVRAELDVPEGWTREKRAFLDVDYEGGVRARLMSLYLDETVFTFKDLTIEAVGERGWLRVERPDRVYLHTDRDELFDVVPDDNLTLFQSELSSFAACVRGEAPCEIGAREGAAMTRLVEAACASNRLGRRVAVNGAWA